MNNAPAISRKVGFSDLNMITPRIKFEHKSEQLISPKRFINRLVTFAFFAFIIISFSLLIGVVGYHYVAHLNWIDSLLNASMILTGMGPVNAMDSDNAKIFASLYSLYSGVAFLSTIGIMLAPALHRLMHIIHLEK
jgi:hypothetical protein